MGVVTILYKNEIDISDINSSHTKIINMIGEGLSVLDVGCACGDIGDYISKNKGCTVVGIEYDRERAEFARLRNVYKQVIQLDMNDSNAVNQALCQYRNAFDCIVCGDILEHLYNPVGVISNLKTYLKDGGYFVISLPNVAHGSVKLRLMSDDFFYSETGLLDSSHIRFFTQSTIGDFLFKSGLELMQFNRVFFPFDAECENTDIKEFPKDIVEYIAQDERAFVYQYVFKAKLAVNGDNETNKLKKLNEAQMVMSSGERKGLDRCKMRTLERL